MRKKVFFVKFFIFFTCFTFFAQEGKLAKGKESLTSQTSSSNSSTVTLKTTSSRRIDNDIENPFARIIWYAAVYTFYGVAFESPWEFNTKMSDAEISNYPYKEASYGNFIYTDSINYNITRFDITNNFVLENSNLYGNNFDVNFRFLKRFAIDLGYLYLFEKVNDKTDSFTLYSALLKYHRIRTQRFDAWFGLGIMRVGSDVDKNGFGLGLGAEWFVAKPISLDFSHKWTNINNQEVHRTKLLLKYHLKNYHISSGYEGFKIGVSKINAFSLGIGGSF